MLKSILGTALILFALVGNSTAGVVGGPQKEAGVVSANRLQEFTYQFEHYQDALIKVTFEIDGKTSATCDKLKVKLLVDGNWLMTGAGRFESLGLGDEECVFEGGYGSDHNYAKNRRKVTVQVINETTERTTFVLTTN